MPKLWSETIAEHRSAVRDAILDATARIVHERGLTGLSMTALAAESGVGRATAYKYFRDASAAVDAWHQREIARHLQDLVDIASTSPDETKLADILTGIAHRRGRRHWPDGALHTPELMGPAEAELRGVVEEVIRADVEAGRSRADVPPRQLAAYAVAALGAAEFTSPADVTSLVQLVLVPIRSTTAPHR